jgi:hypothetical protein
MKGYIDRVHTHELPKSGYMLRFYYKGKQELVHIERMEDLDEAMNKSLKAFYGNLGILTAIAFPPDKDKDVVCFVYDVKDMKDMNEEEEFPVASRYWRVSNN